MKHKALITAVTLLLFIGIASAQNIEEYREPSVQVTGDTVTTTVYLKNTGSDMQEKWLIEQDPILKEESDPWWLLAFTSEQQTCDPDNPEIVHKDYKLQSGEQTTIKLQSRNLEAGKYELKLLSATGCTTGETQEENVVSTDPYGWRTIVQEFKVSKDTPKIEAYRQPTLNINNETGEITGTVYFKNTGSADMEESFIVEMQVRSRTGDLLSTIGRQGTCDPNHPENVHKTFSLDAGASKAITLSSVVPDAGVYDIRFVTATSCMTDGDGVFVEPYIQGVSAYKFNNVAVGKGGNPPPKPPVLPLAVGATLLISAGVLYWRWGN